MRRDGEDVPVSAKTLTRRFPEEAWRIVPWREGSNEILSSRFAAVRNPAGFAGLEGFDAWWNFKFGAKWRRPYGPPSSISGLDDHPVVHVAFRDAEAYATGTGKALPTEADGNSPCARRLRRRGIRLGDEFTPGGKHFANTWQGAFPRGESQGGRFCADLAGRGLPRQRLRPL